MLAQQTQYTKFHLTYHNASALVAAGLLVTGFVLYLWMEVATHSMFYPLVATALFAAFFALPALVLLWRSPRVTKLALVCSFLLLILLVRNTEWNSRKPFLRALDSVRVGMTTAQVDAAMVGFLRGPADGVSGAGTLAFRHTDEGWGNADIGLVTLQDGRVTRVEFLGD